MQSLAVFDIVILSITLILGLKGLMKGLVKEVFGIIGIIGALFVASRVSGDVGALLAPILGLENQNTISLIGFVASLVGFWLIIYIIGTIISKIFEASGLGLFDRVFGFVFGAGKIFLIFAVIAHALYQINSFRKTIDEKTANSIVMPYLLKTGGFIMKLDELNTQPEDENAPKTSTDKALETVGEAVKVIKENTKEITQNVTETVTEQIVETAKQKAVEAGSISEEQMNELKKQLEQTGNTKTEENTNN